MDNNKRILHMNDNTKVVVEKTTVWAEKLGKQVVDRLKDGLDYLRTFTGGGEDKWMTRLSLDVPFDPECPSFIATIYQRLEQQNGHDHPDGLKAYMTIGMIYRSSSQEWSFHS
jgi:hypothetical protein